VFLWRPGAIQPRKGLPLIGAQKQRGLYVYDLAGKTLQVLPDGRMNNVDLRDGFRLGDSTVAIVAASDRTNKSLALCQLEVTTRRLSSVTAAVIPTGFNDPYGLCMYRSGKSGETFVFMNDSDTGAYKQ
jgi:3-phytase